MSEVGVSPEIQAVKKSQITTAPPINAVYEKTVNITESKENTTIKDIVGERARAFLRQSYPLTEVGQILQEEVQRAVLKNDRQRLEELADQLPTVEKPNLHLFKDFELTPEQKDAIFGVDLTNVQVTKGCSHKCEFCAAGSAAKVKTMPFVAVLKIAEQMRAYETKIDEVWDSWAQTAKEKLGIDFEQIFSEWEKSDIGSVDEYVQEKYPQQLEALNLEFQNHPIRFIAGIGLPEPVQLLLKSELFKTHIANYYDSDPFDYRDSTFFHQDGSPADYGDVFVALASELRPIHITTAGWTRENHIAQRAVKKIATICKERPKLASQFRISVNKYEYRARVDYERYREDMKEVIGILMNANGPEKYNDVLFFYDEKNPEDREFIDKVIKPLKQYMRRRNISAVGEQKNVSFYSGPMVKEEAKDDHHDVMACMPGIHILPDGTVTNQKYRWDYDQKTVDKGSRPQPIGTQLYSLSRN